MIDAKYVREITFDKRDTEYHDLSERVQFRIKQEAQLGSFSVRMSFDKDRYSEKTFDTVRKHLRINGFSLMVEEDSNKYIMNISWE